MKRRLLSLALVTTALVSGCQVSSGDEENAVQPVWDLRHSHRIDDVGWPEGHASDSYFVDPQPGDLTILLPEGISIEGPFDVSVGRPPGDTSGDELETIVVNFDREPLAEAAQRARDLASRWGIDGTELAEWAARNARGRDNSPGGASALTPSRQLGTDGPTIQMEARASSDGRAYLSTTILWFPEPAGPG